MLDQTTQEVPGLYETVVAVEGLSDTMPNSFVELRQCVHNLALPHNLKLYGPMIVAEGAEIEIMDGFFRTLHTVHLPIPDGWRNSDW